MRIKLNRQRIVDAILIGGGIIIGYSMVGTNEGIEEWVVVDNIKAKAKRFLKDHPDLVLGVIVFAGGSALSYHKGYSDASVARATRQTNHETGKKRIRLIQNNGKDIYFYLDGE